MQEILDIFGIDWRLLLTQAFNFGVLLIALWYFLYRPVIGMIEKRQQLIKKGVEDAEVAAAERAKTGEEREAVLTDATREASTIIERAKQRWNEREAVYLKDIDMRSQRVIRDAHMRAEEEKRKILESGKEEIAQMAVLGAEKVLKERGS
jgi:F-type H+-transporting ATPase subunit b